jgi:hypothetical protein
MSYDVAIVLPPIPDHDADVWADIGAILDEGGQAPAVFRTMHDRLIARLPDSSSLSDDRVDDSIWSSQPLWTCFGKQVGILNMDYRRVKEALPFIIETARSLGLALIDLSRNQIYRPDGLPGLTLAAEDKPALQSPTLHQVRDMVDALTPNGGPGFMSVDGPKDYAQVAGGQGAFTVEWREYAGEKFQHWVAGYPGRPAEKDVAIPTNGFEVTVKENERLTAEDVKLILSAFAEGKARPAKFAWRNVTERFA